MPKPICVIYYDECLVNSGKRMSMFEVMESIQKRMPDYYVFAIPKQDESGELMEFKVFHEKDFTDIQYEELKQLIADSLPK